MNKKLFALLMAAVMVLSLASCGKKAETPSTSDPGTSTEEPAAEPTTDLPLGYDPETGAEAYGPYLDDWSDMTDE